MNELNELGLKYGTDKGTKHHYLDVYYKMFKNKRNTIEKVLEIGTAEGAGLKMFRDFFPYSIIYGAEIDTNRVKMLKGEHRIEMLACDQSKLADLQYVKERIGFVDLIIDDGSHKSSDQVFTCLSLMRLFNNNPIYIIEDVSEPEIVNLVPNARLIEVGDRYDDKLIIING